MGFTANTARLQYTLNHKNHPSHGSPNPVTTNNSAKSATTTKIPEWPSPRLYSSPSSFGNLPFFCEIAAKYCPIHVQATQQHNFLVPIWACQVLNGATIHIDPF
jgi:hypothetical protein